MGITAAFPVTINTAMVSPIARPIPNMAPAVIPDAEYELPPCKSFANGMPLMLN
jgi:hypothetical protein